MGVRVIDNGRGEAAFYCSTAMWAFGPVFEDEEEARAFLAWLSTDPRKVPESELEAKYYEFCVERDKKRNDTLTTEKP